MSEWSASDIRRLRSLAGQNKYFFTEIAEKIGRGAASTAWKARQLGIKTNPPGRKAAWNCKHAHLRMAAMTYFLTHTFPETAKRFKLTTGELKSLMTVSYRMSEYKHLRKDKRRHDPWSLDDLLFAVRRAGIRPRSWIGKKLKRGGAIVIKERFQTFNAGTKHLNGMPQSWAFALWGQDMPASGIKTDAGPPNGGGGFFVIYPWVTCERVSRQLATPTNIRACIRALAKFQRWIHGVKSERSIINKIKGAVNEK